MDNKLLTKTMFTVPCAGGNLLCRRTMWDYVDAYGPPPVVVDTFLLFQDPEANETRLDSVLEIKSLTPQLNMAEEVAMRPLEWANLLTVFENIGFVVTQSPRFAVLASYGIDLSTIAPRVEQDTLKFTVLEAGLELESHSVVFVEWNLHSLHYRATKVLTVD